MRLKNIVLVVEDVERSKRFYRELFGLEVLRDFDTNVILGQGLVLQERRSWEQAICEQVNYGARDAVLYFEEYDLDAFVEKAEGSGWPPCLLSPLQTLDNGQKLVRLLDPDAHIIEVREMEKF